MRTPKNWSRVPLGHPKFGTGCPLEIWLECQIYGLDGAPNLGQGHSPRICICTFTSVMHMRMQGSAPLNLAFLKFG